MWECKKSRWCLSNPTNGMVVSPSLSSPKNTFLSDFAGKRKTNYAFNHSVFGRRNVTRRKFSLRRHFRLFATGRVCRWVLKWSLVCHYKIRSRVRKKMGRVWQENIGQLAWEAYGTIIITKREFAILLCFIIIARLRLTFWWEGMAASTNCSSHVNAAGIPSSACYCWFPWSN